MSFTIMSIVFCSSVSGAVTPFNIPIRISSVPIRSINIAIMFDTLLPTLSVTFPVTLNRFITIFVLISFVFLISPIGVFSDLASVTALFPPSLPLTTSLSSRAIKIATRTTSHHFSFICVQVMGFVFVSFSPLNTEELILLTAPLRLYSEIPLPAASIICPTLKSTGSSFAD